MLLNLEVDQMRREKLIRKEKSAQASSRELMGTRCCSDYVRAILSQLWRGLAFAFSGMSQ